MFALKYEIYARPLVLLCYEESMDGRHCGQFQLFFVEEMPPWPFAWPSAGVAIAGRMALNYVVSQRGLFLPFCLSWLLLPSLSHEIKRCQSLCSMKSRKPISSTITNRTNITMVKSLQRSLEAKLASIEGMCNRFLELSHFSASHLSSSNSCSSLSDPVYSDGEDDQNEDSETELISAKINKKGTKRNKRKKDSDKNDTSDEPSSVIYLGHLPVGFEEREITVFLNQFGNVMRCRVSRSKKTGRSRGYAFVEFVDHDVAKVVAETMSGYFLLEKRLVCHILPQDQVHELMFAKAKRIATKADIHKKARLEVNKQRSTDALKGITAKLVKREEMKRKKLASLGIDYDFPGYAAGAGVKSVDDAEPASKRRRTTSSDDIEEEVASEKKAPKSSKKKKKKSKVESEKENVTNTPKKGKDKPTEPLEEAEEAPTTTSRRSTRSKKAKKTPKK